jgi:Cdc6-like AAA superfamily ATPase
MYNFPSLSRMSVVADFRKDSSPSPSAFIVHGLEATGKTLILRTLLEESNSSYSWLPCHECITARHLTERIAATVSSSIGASETASQRSENVSALTVYLQQLLRDSERKHFLVQSLGGGNWVLPNTLSRSLTESTSRGNHRQLCLLG